MALYKGETLLALNNAAAALSELNTAETILSREQNPRYMLMLYKTKTAALVAANQPTEAYNMLSLYLEKLHMQQQQTQNQQSNLLRIQFDSVRQQERNAQLKAENKLIEQHVATLEAAQRWQYVALAIIVMLLTIMLVFALSLKQRNQRLHRLAMTDDLTNVANRRQIMMRAENERVKALNTQGSLCFLFST